MKHRILVKGILISLIFLLFSVMLPAQKNIDDLLPVRAFCISAPKPVNVERFVQFINEDLAVNKINTLVLRVDFNYQFKTHPELQDSSALSEEDVRQLVTACKNNHIHLIPQINLLGHQSWAGALNKLLKVYPEFDETPTVQMPVVYGWPNPDSLYCKSYCPLHPSVHKIVFDLVDEICTIFEATAFHAGMDEVFYLGDYRCPRCAGKDKAVLFAGEVNTIRNHLAEKKRKLWIWGDRLIDGKSTGIGEWEGSFNNTQSAVRLISKDIVICDWHYDKAEQTAVYFANNKLAVVTSTWRNPAVAATQVRDMVRYRRTAKPAVKKLYQGVMQTIWSNSNSFIDDYESVKLSGIQTDTTQANCFKAMLNEIKVISETP
ncbi:family 20 glycosylhydrolase [Ferruginibacter paludis]|uniref:family 20 glycosylhydrolase n=1 Tax=Ferruginibacter paludis TaxID=1310417 RepID=UPI0025B4295F|nr:family 20 glycosylhydrolase [Ferruginibacter paludis]MDN3655194.1 family 20 glycosylhydrolase [Ferruginibacter paludis]